MAKQKKSTPYYCQEQLEILQQISEKLVKEEKIPYKKITENFNELCRQRINKFSQKSHRAIQNKLDQILKIQKYDWSGKQIQLILDLTADGNKWSKIAQQPQFVNKGLDHDLIKKKFETELRSKFCILFRQIYPNTKQNQVPPLSDSTLKALLKKIQLKQLSKQAYVFVKQILDLYIGNIPYFGKVINSSRKVKSKQYRLETLSLLDDQMSIQILVSAIIKINSFFKKLKKKQNDDWVEKAYEGYKDSAKLTPIVLSNNEASNTMMTLIFEEEESLYVSSQHQLWQQLISNYLNLECEPDDQFKVHDEQNHHQNEL